MKRTPHWANPCKKPTVLGDAFQIYHVVIRCAADGSRFYFSWSVSVVRRYIAKPTKHKKYDDTMADVFGYAVKRQHQSQPITGQSNDAIKQMLINQVLSMRRVVENGNTIQDCFCHAQANVITNIFNQFEQQGIHCQQLQINPPADKLKYSLSYLLTHDK